MADEISGLELVAKRIYLETFKIVLQTNFPCADFYGVLAEKVKAIAKEYSIELRDCFATSWLARPAFWFAIENVVRYDNGNWSHRQQMTEERKAELMKSYEGCYESRYAEYMFANLKNAKDFKQEKQ